MEKAVFHQRTGYKRNILQKYLLEIKYETLLVVVRIDQIIKFMYTVIFESFG